MKVHLKLLTAFIFLCFVAQGKPICNIDTITIPQKVMDLPKVIQKDGDRAGLWGLPTLIALRYGLTINEMADERLDEMLSTQAAIDYLTDLYKEFGDWDLCYYAYLSSPAHVKNLQARNLDISTPAEKKPVVAYKPDKVKKEEIKKEEVKKEEVKKTEKPQAPKKAKQKAITYVVKKGDSLGKIAKKYHVKVKDIQKWNNLKSDFIREDQKLKIYQ